MAVRVISVSDVVCATTQSVASALFALEIDNSFLLNIGEEGKNAITEINKQQRVIQLVEESERLVASLEKLIGKLHRRFSQAKGGTMRKKIREGKTKVILQEGDVVDIKTMKEQLQHTEVSTNN